MKVVLPFFTFLFIISFSFGQISFLKVTDEDNELANHFKGSGPYIGVSWIDYDNDSWEDCFINSNFLYKNLGNSSFERVDFGSPNPGDGNGNTWGDTDNDGDLDLVIAASPTEYFINDNGTFVLTDFTEEEIDTFNFWSAAFGDYNNDGWLDVFLAHPAGFLPFSGPISRENILFMNDGDGTFTRVLNQDPVEGLAAYTVCSWTDYDWDGDLDLFIGSGEVGFISKDHLYENQLTETGSPDLIRITDGPLAEDLRDGQNWNLIDYDNDNDLDGFVTNYNGGKTNDLYRNDNGTYVKQTEVDAGPIANQGGAGLCNTWGDLDNDGFLDCFVTFDGGQKDRFYYNNGDGTFTEMDTEFTNTGSTRGAALADYDKDGYLDLFVSSTSNSSVGLYHNEGSGNHYISIGFEGTTSNRSAIGTKVWAKATINGTPMWQFREINAQNSFNGHNSLRTHFGFGDAATIDSLIVQWPLGDEQIFTNVETDVYCELKEGELLDCAIISDVKTIKATNPHFQVFPNPANEFVKISLEKEIMDSLTIRLFDVNGRLVKQEVIDHPPKDGIRFSVEKIPAGNYKLSLSWEAQMESVSIVIQ